MNNNEPAQSLNNTVIANGYCVGCGACASLEDSPYKMSLNKIGQYEAELKDEKIIAKTFSLADEVCPFSSISSNEDELSKELFGESCDYDTSVGFYHSSFAGYVKEGSFRAKGSSGGFGTWILQELLRTKTVDYIINVQANTLNSDKFEQPLFSYSICSSASEIQAGSKSRYYPIELSDVLTRIRSLPGTYAIVGLPCFIKSIRLLQRKDSELAARIRFCIGLVCGHLKSTRYAQSLAWQSGIVPSELQGIDFRVKNPSGVANRYSTSITGGRSEQVVPTHNLFGTDWGSGAFKYKACDFCDDVFAETADVVVGDAWLPKYVQDGKGTNILVVRNQAIQNLRKSVV